MSVELVSGWADGDTVYVVERSGDDTRIRALPAKWSAFVENLEDDDRRHLQRMKEVRGLQVVGNQTRIDFRDRYARKNVCWQLKELSDSNYRVTGRRRNQPLEADVNPLRRLLSDFPALTVSATPRLAWFDLETDSRKTFNEAREGKSRILSWALVDHRGAEFHSYLENESDAAEKHLIEELLIAARESDVMIAWNGDGFDFPVLEARAMKLRVLPNGRHPLWHRWCWLDHLEVYKKYNQHAHESGDEKSSFKLDDVAHNVLGTGKDPFDSRRTYEAWAAGGDELARLLRYNRKDAKLLPEIEAKTGYIALHLAASHITRCFPDTASLMASQQGDGFLLSLGAQHGHRWPSKIERDYEAAYEGAYVMEPTRLGIVDNVHVADFASLYPSIMRTWNMSPDTLLASQPANASFAHCRLPTARASCFRLDRRGMLPLALDQLVAKRSEYTKRAENAEPMSDEFEHYKRLSQAFKVVANSFYGIVGSAFTRFFCREVAEGVTQTGAWLIKANVVERARTAGLDPFYGDTDSVFVSGDSAAFAEVVRQLNAEWPALTRQLGCDRSLISLEFEKSFRRLVIVSAKRYAGVFSVYKGKPVADGRKPEVKGLEYKRGDSVKLAREMQRELIWMLLGDREGAVVPPVDDLVAWVERWRNRVLHEPLALADIVLSQSVRALSEYKERYTSRTCGGAGRAKSKKCGFDYGGTDRDGDAPDSCPRCGTIRKIAAPQAHVRVAKVLAERGEEIRDGTRVEYLIVASNGERLEAVPAHDAGALESIDRDYYWSSRIYPPCSRVLEAAFPTVTWVETSAQKKLRLKTEAIGANRGVDGLPLFETQQQQ
jgi:DNA polymerase elongation subunit (family B)